METATDWPAIFAGTFVFMGIEATFGLLAVAIFGFGAAPYLGTGLGIWMLILTIVALGVGGAATTHLAALDRVPAAVYHALTMFGLSIFTSILVALAVEFGQPTAAFSLMTLAKHNALWLFFFLLLGGIAACADGARSQRGRLGATERAVYRPAA